MKNKILFITSLLIIITIILGAGFNYYLYLMPVNYVGIDINPSIELSLNRQGEVIEAIPLNEEADILLSDVAIKNMTSDQAVETIVQNSTDMGYIDELAEDNTIVVSVTGENTTETTKMEDKINTKIKTYLTKENIPALILLEKNNEERKAKAETYGISNGKMLLIQKAVALDPTLVEAELANQSVKSIAKLIIAARKEIIKANVKEKKQELENKKAEIKTAYRAAYRKATNDIIKNSNQDRNGRLLTEGQKTRIINSAKKEIIEKVETAQKEIQNNWSNIDNNSTKIPPKLKEKIQNAKNKWSNKDK